MANIKISDLPLATSVGQYDLVPVVQNAVTKAARVNMLGTGTASAGTSTAMSAVINVTDAAYGAKADGIILNDLVVTSGSTSISSATGPFVSTAVDAGKLVYWRVGSNAVGFGTIATVQSTTQATLTSAPTNGSTSDGGPNTNGCVGTDNTTALNAAFTAAQAKQTATTQNRLEHTPSTRVHFPAGVYVTKALATMSGRGITVSGDGKHATFIASGDGSAPWFQLGTFNANPSYVFNSGYNQEFWQFRDMQFINPCFRNGSSEGSRNSIAIQDNGNGDTVIRDCIFMGHKYGFAGAYATDFSSLGWCYFYLCDVGAYFGPGSQQLEISKTDFSYCREGVVFEGVEHWHIGSASSFEDNYIASITIDGTNGSTTRFGLPRQSNGSWYTGTMVIDGNTWFETNSGNSSRLSPRQVWITGDGSYGVPFRRFTMRDALVIAGGNQVSGANNTLVEIATAGGTDGQIVLDGVQVGGKYLNSLVRSSGSGQARVIFRNVGKEEAGTVNTQGSVALLATTLDGKLTGYTLN